MKSKQLYEAVDELAPFALSREYIEKFGAYDNSGLLIGGDAELTGVLFSLDLSPRAVSMAKERGYNAIVTHHPAIWEGLKRVDGTILDCAAAGISVVSAHLNLDAAPGGIDDCLMQGLGGKAAAVVMEQLSGGGYGKVYDVQKTELSAFVGRAKETFCTGRVVCYGEGSVLRVASFCGAGFTERAIAFAAQNGADTIVTSDGKHHLVTAAAERGINVVLLTHYAAENYGFCLFAEKMRKKLGDVPCAVFTDGRFL